MTAATVPLRYVAEVLVSNIDKKSIETESPVRLVNYTDVYYRDAVSPNLELMQATATRDQIDKFRLRIGDSIITKDSETADDIAVSTYVCGVAPDMVCGYHLAIIRSRGQVDPRYLTWALQSDLVRQQFSNAANGMTRFGLTYDSIESVVLPIQPGEEQQRIAEFLDDHVARIDDIIAARQAQAAYGAEAFVSEMDSLFASSRPRSLRTLLARAPCYGVLVPRFVDSGGVPFIRVTDLESLAHADKHLIEIESGQSVGYRRTIVAENDVLVSVVGSIDKAAIVPARRAGANIARAVSRLTPALGMPSTVILGWTRTSEYRDQARLETGGDTAQPTLNMGDLAKFKVSLPDGDLDLLADRVAAVHSHQEQGLELLRRSIGFAQELKRSLITAAVAGEFDLSSADGSRVPA